VRASPDDLALVHADDAVSVAHRAWATEVPVCWKSVQSWAMRMMDRWECAAFADWLKKSVH